MVRLISFLVAIIIGHMGLKIYLHQRIASEIDKVIAIAHPFVDIRYEGISTSLINESMSIEGLEIIPQSSNTVSIRRLTFFGADVFESANDWYSNVNFDKPMHQGLKIDGLILDIDDLLLYSQGATQSKQWMSLEDIKRLGYSTLDTDFYFSIKTFPESKYIDILYQQSHKNMFNFEIRATFTANSLDFNQINPMISPNAIQLVSASITFKDDSISEKYYASEARKQGKTVDAFKEEMFAQFQATLEAKHLTLSKAQMKAIQNSIESNAPLTISIKPKHPLGFKSMRHMHLYKPNDVVNMLNLTIRN